MTIAQQIEKKNAASSAVQRNFDSSLIVQNRLMQCVVFLDIYQVEVCVFGERTWTLSP